MMVSKRGDDVEVLQVVGWSSVWKYREMEDNDERMKVDVYVDSDWASGWSRKSTNKWMLTVDGVGWSTTQKARALTGGEAEYNAMVTGCALGCTRCPRTWAEGRRSGFVGNRRGLGTDVVKEGQTKLKTVNGPLKHWHDLSVSAC